MKVEVAVRGMHCAGCIKTIEEAAREVPGVRDASVNFATERAVLDIDPGAFRSTAFQQALRDRGYRAAPERLAWRVSGLDPSGVASLEERLRALPGVAAAAANPAAGTVAVDLLFPAEAEGLLRDQGLSPEKEEALEGGRESLVPAVRTGVALVLAAAVMSLQMLHAGPPWLWAALAAPVQFWAGWPFHAGFLASLRHARADMNTLVSLGTNVAFFAGLAGGTPYYDTAAVILAVVLLGRLLEGRARRGTRRAVEALLELAPRSDVRPGDERLVRPGERFPADGVVLEGSGPTDESMLTGESDPVDKAPGDRVLGGTLNRTGALRVRFDRTGDDTVLAQIVRVVRETQGTKPALQRLADAWAARFVPLVLLLAAATFAAWAWIDPSHALAAAVAVLVVACPCAFGLATPAAILVATGAAARRGILFKDARALESIGRIERVVFDKTGTLTLGRPAVTLVRPAPGFDRDEVLRLAASVERSSEHPLARTIAAAAPDAPAASGFDARPGLGAVARLDGREVFVGSRAFFALLDIDLSALRPDLEAAAARGETAVLVGVEGRLAGLITLADTPRPEAARALEGLRRQGLAIGLLTGDDAATAGAVARSLGIEASRVMAEVMPADKAAAVREMQRDARVAMVGDGINDAPALVQADVGIALHQGTDVAIEAADVVIMKSDLGRIPEAVALGRAARRVIHQNFAWAFGYNALLIPLAAGLFRPWGLDLHPMAAAAAMALSSITVLLNSLRLR